MIWLKNILGGLFGNAASIIDEVVTTKEEKEILKNQLERIILETEKTIQDNVTERWKADMASDSWLSKNVRPLTLIFLVVSTVILVFIDAGFIAFEVKDNWVSLLEIILVTVIAAYFGGRSVEKVRGTTLNQPNQPNQPQ